MVIDYVYLVKYYKDTKGDSTQIEILIEDLKHSTHFDTTIKNRLLLYLYNNYFSLVINGKNTDNKTIKDLYNRIYSIQKQYRLHNYFIHYKYLEYLNRFISNSIYSTDTNPLIYELLYEYSIVVNRFRHSIDNWKHPINPDLDYDLCYDSMALKLENQTIRLFSLFHCPRNSNTIEDNYKILKEQYSILQKHFELSIQQSSMLKDQFHEYQKKSELEGANLHKDIQNDVKKTEKRSIEIITLFSAIVMFVAGDLQLFKNISDTKSAINVMLVFGFSLSVFVGLIAALVGNMDSLVFRKKAPNSDTKESWLKRLTYKQLFMWYLLIGLGVILFCNYFLNSPVITRVVYSLFNIPITIN